MICVIDNGNYRAQVFLLDGTFVRAWDTFGTGDGQFQSPRGIAVTANGKVFVADLMQIPSHGFHIDGVFLRVFASHRPHGITLLIDGHVVATWLLRTWRYSAFTCFSGTARRCGPRGQPVLVWVSFCTLRVSLFLYWARCL